MEPSLPCCSSTGLGSCELTKAISCSKRSETSMSVILLSKSSRGQMCAALHLHHCHAHHALTGPPVKREGLHIANRRVAQQLGPNAAGVCTTGSEGADGADRIVGCASSTARPSPSSAPSPTSSGRSRKKPTSTRVR